MYLRLVDADKRSQPCRSKLAGVYQVFDLTVWVKGLYLNILSKHSISFKERLVFHGLLEMRAAADLIGHLLGCKKFYAADKNFRPIVLHRLLKLLWRELHNGAISRRDKLWRLWKFWTDLWPHQHLDTIFQAVHLELPLDHGERWYDDCGGTWIKCIQNFCQTEEAIIKWQICQQVAHQGARGEPVQAWAVTCHSRWAPLPTGAAGQSGLLLPILDQPEFKDVLTSNQFLYNNQAYSSNLKVAQHLGKLRMVSSQLSVFPSHDRSPPL